MGTTGISATGTLNNNDEITDIKDAVIADRDLYVNNAGDINTYLVHIRQTDATGTEESSDTNHAIKNILTKGVFLIITGQILFWTRVQDL